MFEKKPIKVPTTGHLVDCAAELFEKEAALFCYTTRREIME